MGENDSSPSDTGGNMSDGGYGLEASALGDIGGYGLEASALGDIGGYGLGEAPGGLEASALGDIGGYGLEASALGNPEVNTNFMDDLMGFYNNNKGVINAFGKTAIGLMGKSSPLGALASALYGGYNAMSNPQATTGGIVGQTAMGGFGPVSGMLGGMAGSSVLGGMSPTGAAPEGNTSAGKDMNYMDFGAGLGNLYLQGKAAHQTSGLADSLASLYGQDSPYSQMLRQQLVRQDAKSGRRSQYGGREVELQARLAALNSQNAPQLHQLQQNANLQRMQQLNQLWALNRMGGGKMLGGLYDRAKAGLGGLYDQAQGAWNSYNAPPVDNSQWYDGGYGGDG